MLLKIARPASALVRDNLIPSPARWERTLPLGREILQAIRQREPIIAERGLDRAFGLPDANWSDTAESELRPANDFRLAVERLATLEWDELRHLRLMAQAFSGYSMRELVPAWQVPSVGAIPADFDDKWQKADFSAFLTRWRALVHGLPDWALNKPPHMLGEFGLWQGDVIVNSDTASYQERMTLLHSAGVLQRLRGLGRPARVLEIGGGYGALSLAVRRALPDCAYTICDLPESLLFSGLYLSLVGDEPVSMFDGEPRPGTVALLPNYLFHDLGTPFDLVINTLSMSEMSAYQIRAYAAGIKVLIGETGLFFEQNHDSRPAGLEFAAPLIMPFFQHGAIVMIEVGLTLGHANLWANTAAALPG